MAYQKISQIIAVSNPRKPKFELSNEQLEKLETVSHVVLAVLAVAGIATLSIVAPNMLQVVGKLFLRKGGKRFTTKERERQTARAIYYLKNSNLIKMKPMGKDFEISLSEEGIKKAGKLNIMSLRAPRFKQWNGRWWQVAADIPTKEHRQAADLLRKKLKEMSFYPLQRTLWFYPFDPRREVEFIVNTYNIARFVTVMEVSRLDLEDEKVLKSHFQALNVL